MKLTNYAYDANGNLSEKTEKSTGRVIRYTFDADNRLTRIDFPDRTFTTYHYDGLGRRIEKNVNGQITRYIYDNEDILLETDAAGTLLARYTHSPGIDEPLIIERGGQRFFYHTNSLGSIAQVTDSTGAVVQSYIYDSFGLIVQQMGTLPNLYTYTAREVDPESGLYYYRARYYDPRTGRFVSEDPNWLTSGANRYIYVDNNPLIFSDPSGECPWCIAVLIGGAGGAVTDIGIQLLFNGGRWDCINWGDVAISAALGGLLTRALEAKAR